MTLIDSSMDAGGRELSSQVMGLHTDAGAAGGTPCTRTSGLYRQVGHDPLGANDVDSLALILALVMEGNTRDPECSRGQDEVPPVHRELAPWKAWGHGQPRGTLSMA